MLLHAEQPPRKRGESTAVMATILARLARKTRLDSLYEVLTAAGIDNVDMQKSTSLTRASLDRIFDLLISEYHFSGRASAMCRLSGNLISCTKEPGANFFSRAASNDSLSGCLCFYRNSFTLHH